MRYLRITTALFVTIFLLNSALLAQTKKIGNSYIKNYTSIAKVSGTAEGTNVSYTNPYTNQSTSNFAGVFSGTLNSDNVKFYCIDLQHPLEFNKDYWDEDSTPSEITFILNNYFPYKTSYPGKLSDNKEAAAVQFAIWHFSDGLNANTITNNYEIKNRALAIIADADANHNDVIPLETLLIIPQANSYTVGTPATLEIFALDLNGNPVENAQIQLSTTFGTLSSTTVTTNVSGRTGLITLTSSGVGTAIIKAKTIVEIPQGTRYINKKDSNGKQKLVLATPSTDMKEVSASVEWYNQSSDCDLNGFTTYTQGGWGGPSNSGPGKIRDINFNSVFPTGLVIGGNYKLTLNSAMSVKGFLPQGGTAGAFSQNYTDVTTTSAGVLAGQLVALKMNVMYNAAGKLGSNSTQFGDLVIASGPFFSYTVYQFLTFAEQAIGGGSLNGFSFSEINDAATAINENFDNGTTNEGYLTCVVDCENIIGDYVWHDTNLNGIQDLNEAGIKDVVVELYDNYNTLITTSTTDVNGKYEFSNLTNGTYKVKVAESNYASNGVLESTTQTKWYSTKKNQGGDDSKDSDADNSDWVVVSVNCNDNLTVDFGFYKTCVSVVKTADKQTASVGDIITYTFTVENCGDVTLGGGVDFYDAMLNNNGDHKIKNISPVNPGEIKSFTKQYTVQSTDCGALVNTVTAIGHPTDGSAVVEFTSSVTVDVICKASIGDKVWEDLNKNGIQDNNEPGVQDVVVKLYDCSNNFVAQLNTDVNGNYLFSNLTPGDYYVIFEAPTGYVITNKDAGGDDSKDSDADATTGKTVCTTLTDGEIDLTWDAGIYKVSETVDIEVIKTTSNVNPQNGDQFDYTITVTNNGPVDASNVQVTDILPAGVLYINSSASNGSLYNSTTGIWDAGSLANSASAVLTVTVEVNLGDCQSIDLGAAEGYNLFIFGDLNQPSADTEGKVAIGGNAYFANYSIGDKLAPNSGDVLIVEGHLEYVSGGVFNGNVVYGTSTNLPQNSVSILNGTLRQDHPIDFAAAEVYLKSLSASLSAYPANGTVVNDWNNLILTGTDPFINVFSVSGSELSNAWGTTINVPNGAVVLLNVDGQNIDWNGGLFINGTAITNVLYNFYEAESMLVQGIDVRGTLLAPHADLHFPAGVVNGQVIVKSMAGSGQFNSGQFNNSMFTGNIPCSGSIVNYARLSSSIPTDNNSANNESYVNVTIGDGQGNTGGNDNGGTDNTEDWEPAGSFGLTEVVWSIASDLQGNLLAGTAGGHLYKSTDGGVNWILINAGMTIGFIWDIAVNPTGAIVIGTEQGIFYTEDNGANWSGPLGGYVHDIRAVEIDQSTGEIYAAAWGFGIFKSVNNGTDWSKVNDGLTSLIVNSISIDNQGRIYAGTFGGGVFVSSNGGSNWTKSELGYDFVWALATTSNNIVYAATYGKGVYRSTDNGSTWEELNSGLTAEHVYSVAVNANDEVYVSTWLGGIYKLTGVTTSAPSSMSTTTSFIWSAVGMNGYGISALMVDKNASMIYAGSSDGTIYKKKENYTPTDVNSQLDGPVEFNLSQNYPNPFNPSTKIEFGIKENGEYSLIVYNIIGQQVAELVNGELNAGRHQVQFDASRLSSGIYIYKLAGSKVNITRKMILMK